MSHNGRRQHTSSFVNVTLSTVLFWMKSNLLQASWCILTALFLSCSSTMWDMVILLFCLKAIKHIHFTNMKFLLFPYSLPQYLLRNTPFKYINMWWYFWIMFFMNINSTICLVNQRWPVLFLLKKTLIFNGD